MTTKDQPRLPLEPATAPAIVAASGSDTATTTTPTRAGSREQWAEAQRTRYLGDECPQHFLDAHAHLVPAGLREAAIAELDALWKALAPHIRGAQGPVVDKLWRTGAISSDEAIARTDTPADAALDLRHEIRRGRQLDLVYEPLGYAECVTRVPAVGQAHPLVQVKAYLAAREAQRVAADADWGADVANTPIDDAAWARELEWRAEFGPSGIKCVRR